MFCVSTGYYPDVLRPTDSPKMSLPTEVRNLTLCVCRKMLVKIPMNNFSDTFLISRIQNTEFLQKKKCCEEEETVQASGTSTKVTNHFFTLKNSAEFSFTMDFRANQMAVDQDWGNVWPGPRSFHPATVPLPIHQGYVPKNMAAPGKFANAELMKIPNFLHLTPPVIKRQCEALKKFCTPWPANLETDEKIAQHFPIDVITSGSGSSRFYRLIRFY